jgi:hypothetical protein
MTREDFDTLVELIELVAGQAHFSAHVHPADRSRQEAKLREYEAQLDWLRDRMTEDEPQPEWRYFYHPESNSLWAERSSVPPPTDPLVEEIDQATFERLKAENEDDVSDLV